MAESFPTLIQENADFIANGKERLQLVSCQEIGNYHAAFRALLHPYVVVFACAFSRVDAKHARIRFVTFSNNVTVLSQSRQCLGHRGGPNVSHFSQLRSTETFVVQN